MIYFFLLKITGIEWFGLGETLKLIPFHPCLGQGQLKLDQISPTLSKPALDNPRDGVGCLY